MAGDWIKMTVSLPDKPEVWAIAERLEIDGDAVVGKLFRVWAWFDQNTADGNAPSVTKKIIDRITSVSGFAEAMSSAGWLVESDGTISVPNFDRHNGKTAKDRALTAKRVQRSRNAEGNGAGVTEPLPEKRREENNKNTQKPLRFDEFWMAYPRKEAKAAAKKAWGKITPAEVDLILSNLATRAWPAEPQFIPLPASYLNGRRWEDAGAAPIRREFAI